MKEYEDCADALKELIAVAKEQEVKGCRDMNLLSNILIATMLLSMIKHISECQPGRKK